MGKAEEQPCRVLAKHETAWSNQKLVGTLHAHSHKLISFEFPFETLFPWAMLFLLDIV